MCALEWVFPVLDGNASGVIFEYGLVISDQNREVNGKKIVKNSLGIFQHTKLRIAPRSGQEVDLVESCFYLFVLN